MGTNYYLSDGRHVGKQSAGWRFLAQADTAENWDSLADLLGASGVVIDEYGDRRSSIALRLRIDAHAHEAHHPDAYSSGAADFYRGEFS